jgi:hypothetical protein
MKQSRVKVNALLHKVGALRKRQVLIPFALEVSSHPLQRRQSLKRRCLAAGNMEMAQLVVALVDRVMQKTTDIVNDQISMIDKRHPPRGGITKKLIAQAAQNARDDLDQSNPVVRSEVLCHANNG